MLIRRLSRVVVRFGSVIGSGVILVGRVLCTVVAILLIGGCASWFHPSWTKQEKNILHFNVQGIGIGSPPSHLKIFPQTQKNPQPQDGMDVYQVFNPNPHISTLIAWYQKKKLHKLELRYFNASGVETLKVSGGWEGLQKDLFDYFGPPSEFGPQVPLATAMKLDPQAAKFNGVWIFSRVHRQLNYTAEDDGKSGVAVITLTDTTPPKKKKKSKKNQPDPNAPPATQPGPGFSIK